MNVDLPPAWAGGAVCVSVDPELWFPDPATGHNTASRAQRICATCPVVNACADYALADPDLDGVWGGLSARQRARIRTEQRRNLEWTT